MPTTSLKNFIIEERTTTTTKETFFLIKDHDTDQVFFCFSNKVKEGWVDLVRYREQIKEVQIDYEENEKGNKVIGLWASREGEFII